METILHEQFAHYLIDNYAIVDPELLDETEMLNRIVSVLENHMSVEDWNWYHQMLANDNELLESFEDDLAEAVASFKSTRLYTIDEFWVKMDLWIHRLNCDLKNYIQLFTYYASLDQLELPYPVKENIFDFSNCKFHFMSVSDFHEDIQPLFNRIDDTDSSSSSEISSFSLDDDDSSESEIIAV